MRPWGLIPVRCFTTAKSRLAPVLKPPNRAQLARALFEHVLGVLVSSPHLAGVAVVTNADEVASLAQTGGAIVIRDPIDAQTLADRIDSAFDVLAARGADSALVFMSDLPDLTERDVQILVRELSRVDMVIVKDERGAHTNALGVRLEKRQRTHFGAPDSFKRHCESAVRAGFTLATPESATLSYDIDTPGDLERLTVTRSGV